MEPDIIRMYSSSPPPLDNGAEEDDDDEFGGFSGVSSSGVGFADFDTPSYTNSKEEFLPPNHFMPIYDYSDTVDSFANFTATKIVKDKDCFTEIPDSTKGHSDVLQTNASNEKIQSRTSDISLDGKSSPEGVQIVVEQKETIIKQDSFSPEVIRADASIISRDQEMGNCNGDKAPCLETLTNGFAVLDPVNPQGTEDLDSITDSKGLKTVSTHSTELSLDSTPSPVEDFADFSTFSNKDNIHLTEQRTQTEKGLDGDSWHIQDNVLNAVGLLHSLKRVSDTNCEDADEVRVTDGCICTSEVHEGMANHEHNVCVRSTMHSPTWSSVNRAQSTESREHYALETTLRQTDQELDPSKTPDCFKTAANDVGLRKVQVTSSDPANKNGLGPLEGVINNGNLGESVSSGGSSNDDFGAVDGIVCPSENTLGSCSNLNLEKPSEEFAPFSESGDEFGDPSSASHPVLPDFDQSELKQISDPKSEPAGTNSDAEVSALSEAGGKVSEFASVPKTQEKYSTFQDSEDFADFSMASCHQGAEWNAFEDDQQGALSWAAFQDEQTDSSSCEREAWHSHQTAAVVTSEGEQVSRTGSAALPAVPATESIGCVQDPVPAVQSSLLGRLERIFLVCFPSIPVNDVEEKLTSLRHLLETEVKEAKLGEAMANTGELLHVWTELQDIHDTHGLRYQWGGSHSNKKLLCSLGIDTRNILFTGNKKQPVIVPMYAAGLGMLEPTKEPLKPVSAAEKIASIGQTPPVSPEMSACTADQFQDSLPPVQFDWSSSGLTNPLDASGGSTLLNLDFFGPVDDSSSLSTTTIPGVDPELYELTTSKLETSNTSSKVTDAFARLMSTVEKTSTSTRKPRKDEHLSEEAAMVIASLPDLSFMHAKVLMFPATLTPAATHQEKLD
ncbi:aftiphilin isoform X2 [Rhinatrema bivittatum]|uniref:aftiphilin isoform X2 n=1 Tax=Rhinatrema bivittatum TaxID=194408 RepID=UPI001129CA5F|nr:aftiphilin isoform X2 [Rhinatrema bivittatum]